MLYPNINVVLMDNPFGIKGSVNPNYDGSYTIIINSHLSYEEQLKTYRHELSHILSDDFEKDCSVDSIEATTHNFNL